MSFFNNQGSSGAFGSNPAGTPPASSNIFGAGTLGGAKPPGAGLFGSTTPAAPASGGLFGANSSGAPPASGGLFGNNNATPAAPASGGLFSGAAANSGAKPPPSLFGGAPAGGPSNIFGSTSTTSAAPSTNIFGASAQPPASNPLFGGAPIKPADPASAQQKPAANFFNAPSTSSTAPTTGGFNLPAKPADASAAAPTNSPFSTPAATTPTPASSLFSLGGNKNAPAPGGASAPPAGGFFAKPAAAPAANAPAASPFSLSLGGAKDGAPAAPAPSLFAPKTDEKKDGTPAFSLTKPKEGEKAPTPLAGASSALAGPIVAVAPPSMLRGKTIEEIVNKWSGELETHVREFNKFAGEVAVWDRALIENGNNLAALYSHVLAAEREQNDIDQSLDHIEQQQKDLSSTLDAYEKATQEVFGGHGGNLRALDTGPADTERDKNYMLATDLHTQLDDLSGSLTQMIESVNGLSLPSGPEDSGDDPMGQIAQILGSHLESLQWIDGAVREVEGKVTEVEKRVKDSGYNPGASNGVKRGYGL
ncbi:Nsp1-like C-terminal region-domain-containing protein [Mycena alexandri]|uniref:Nucleoporin NSP1 n=1 Tax=Mycena alexandri TaxID=1745969 RepID=A0AAD6XEX4_9AGAR|nr:Nsp1-like C-terminal region-domain-containing protein [Mycena alexandri]